MRYNFFLYILVRKDNTCFKVGITENITSRIRNLINFGPFDINKTKLIPLYTKKKIREWEKEIKERYKKYNFHIKTLKKSNGEQEWYSIDCLDKLINDLNHKIEISLTSDLKILNKDTWNNKISFLLSKERFNQKKYSQEIKESLLQFLTKMKNLNELKKLIDTLIPLEIIGIESIKYQNGYQYKILCKKGKTKISFLNNPQIILTEKNTFYSSFICDGSKENDEYICYKINLSNKELNKHWISKDFCSELNDYFYHRGYKKYIPLELKDLLNFEIDYFNAKIIYNGNKIIDEYIFNIFGKIDRYLPQKMNNDFLKIIFEDLDSYLREEKELEKYIFLIFISMLIQKKYLEGKNTLNKASFSPTEFDLFINNFYSALFLELAKRNKYIDNYQILTFENILEENINTFIEFNRDFVIDCIMKNYENSDI